MITNTGNDTPRAVSAALILAAGALAASAVFAAEPRTDAQVTIHAERPTAKVVGHTSSGVPITVYQLTYHVSYRDLDLVTSGGADALKKRVREAADSLCKDLDKLYPMTEPDRSCARNAEEDAMSQVSTAIKVAQTQATTKAK
jgi:UrcA family protein